MLLSAEDSFWFVLRCWYLQKIAFCQYWDACCYLQKRTFGFVLRYSQKIAFGLYLDAATQQKGDTVACSVGELKITFASTCNHGCKESVFNVLFLVLDFPLGAPNTLLKHVIEGSIWRIVVGEGSWWGWGFSQDWWLGFWSCWNLSLTAVFWIDFSVACFKRV